MKKIALLVICGVFICMAGCSSSCKYSGNDAYKDFKNHGMASWFDLMTTDTDGAKEFYSKLFGWTFVQGGTAEMPYDVAVADGKMIAGVYKTPEQAEGVPPYWGVYITVDDVDKSAELVKELGGNIILDPQDVPDMGRFCVIQDPQGAVIYLITYKK